MQEKGELQHALYFTVEQVTIQSLTQGSRGEEGSGTQVSSATLFSNP